MATSRTIALALPILLAFGCEDMKPRTANSVPAPQQETAQADNHASPGDVNWNSSSSLGKARDAAVRTKAKVDAYQEEVAKQADDVFKKP
jgi:hypothetical protein